MRMTSRLPMAVSSWLIGGATMPRALPTALLKPALIWGGYCKPANLLLSNHPTLQIR